MFGDSIGFVCIIKNDLKVPFPFFSHFLLLFIIVTLQCFVFDSSLTDLAVSLVMLALDDKKLRAGRRRLSLVLSHFFILTLFRLLRISCR